MPHWAVFLLLGATALIAGIQNAFAGGGSFITFPALILFGMGARAANITSTVARFPGQLATGYAVRSQVCGLTRSVGCSWATRRHAAGATRVRFCPEQPPTGSGPCCRWFRGLPGLYGQRRRPRAQRSD
jgi:hypothetical protein